jgi:hypothetical protein
MAQIGAEGGEAKSRLAFHGPGVTFGDEVSAGRWRAKIRVRQRSDAVQAWVEEELESAGFGDKRLDARFRILMDDLSEKPSASIPTACDGWTETCAAYRFFDNRRVDARKVLEPHREATLKRIAEHRVVLVIQDTTELDLTRPQERMKGAGPLNDESRWGFYAHPLLAVTPERIPLGVVKAKVWARDLEKFRAAQRAKAQDRHAKDKRKKKLPVEEKESHRWVEGYRAGCELAEQVPETTIVVISDSEADMYECFLEASPKDEKKKAEWITRACQDRNLSEQDSQGYAHLRQKVASTRVLGTMEVEVRERPATEAKDGKRNQPRSARTASMTIQATRVTLRAPQRPGGRPANVAVNVILVREQHPPAGEEPVEWLLLTSLPITHFKKVCRVIEYYCCRWQIEIYFRVLKSGCKVEERQFEDAKQYLPCLASYMVIAWRVMYVMMLGRECPDMSCAKVFSEAEWKSVFVVVRKASPPETPPTLQEMIDLIGRLGGHLGRAHDGPPGPKAMWIGMQRMADLALAWRAFGPAATGRRGRKKCV